MPLHAEEYRQKTFMQKLVGYWKYLLKVDQYSHIKPK